MLWVKNNGMGTRMILLVDENANFSRLLQLMLRESLHRIVAVHTRVQTTNLLETERPDLVILNASTSGPQACSLAVEIRKVSNGARVPIIMLAVHSRDVSKQKAIESGVDFYFTGPIFADTLIQTIDRFLPRRRE